MSVVSVPVSESPRQAVANVVAPRQGQGAAAPVDVTVSAIAFAILAILGMFTAFAALAGAMPVVVVVSLASVVLSVVTAFSQLRRAGL